MQKQVKKSSNDSLGYAAELVGVEPEVLGRTFTRKTLRIVGQEDSFSDRLPADARQARNAFSKFVYSKVRRPTHTNTRRPTKHTQYAHTH